MATALAQLLSLLDEKDPYDQDPAEIAALQLSAARDLLDERREQIPILDRRVRDVGLAKLGNLADLIPLLFAHTTYKSYPDSFVTKGRWASLLSWFATLSTQDVSHIDLTGVTDVDSWVARLWDSGCYTYMSSGTSGKCSFLPLSAVDRDNLRRMTKRSAFWPDSTPDAPSFRWYTLGPSHGFTRGVDLFGLLAKDLARPGATRAISDRPMMVSEINEMGAMRKAMMNGTASPSDIARFQVATETRSREMQESIRDLAADVVEHRDEPIAILGLWSLHYAVVEAARALGHEAGGFHPDSVIYAAGGTKGAKLPVDYIDQIYSFYGDVHRPRNYGMTEISGAFPLCEAGRYHRTPWCMMLVLDETGETLLNAGSGQAQGRAAFLDLSIDGRWPGIVTGDRISVDFDRCACGRWGPTVGTDVARFTELNGSDDKLSCAGTMEAYIRGVIEP